MDFAANLHAANGLGLSSRLDVAAVLDLAAGLEFQLVWSPTLNIAEIFSIYLWEFITIMLEQDLAVGWDVAAGLNFAAGFDSATSLKNGSGQSSSLKLLLLLY